MNATSVRGRFATLALTLAGAATVMLGGAGTAAASASGCTYTAVPRDYVCHYVHGKGLHVDSVDVIRGRWGGGAIRNFSAMVTIQERDGDRYAFTSPTYREKRFGRVVITFDFDRSFEHGSKVCSSFFEDDVLQDTVCNEILK
jgi:hypothetical protein